MKKTLTRVGVGAIYVLVDMGPCLNDIVFTKKMLRSILICRLFSLPLEVAAKGITQGDYIQCTYICFPMDIFVKSG
jgi:hypothetical protein